MTIKMYKVVNRRIVESLARQLDLPVGIEEVVETEATGTVKFLGARRKRQRTIKGLELNDPRLVDMLIEALRDSGNLVTHRPERNSEWDQWMSRDRDVGGALIHEFWMDATPVTLPTRGKFEEVGGPKTLRVWVVDPVETNTQPEHEWDFIGSFVFLVEELEDADFPTSVVSGVSALRALVDVVAGHDPRAGGGLVGLTSRETEDLGRDSPDHPIEKLKRAGGIPGTPRMVDVIYKIAYMTDEQVATLKGQEVRVNDILAYPLVIYVL
ncbi:hypothetical protein [Streptomyces malaysiensis]|uniref:hypothetical protein n=1 Tax=Streptomyces malaysiensis TaxID=92644 RepID=UPI0011B03569|nr:hypothetical protein [Streptomyces malaysiensis]